MLYKHTKVGNVENYIFNEEVTPLYLKHKGSIKKITKIPNDFFKIKEWRVKVVDNVLVELTIMDSFHPNASHEPNATGGVTLNFSYPPSMSYFCLPESLKNKNLGVDYNIDHYTNLFVNLLREYNYDSGYWIRWEGFEFVEYQDIFEKESIVQTIPKITRKPATFKDVINNGINTAINVVKEESTKALVSTTKEFLNSSVIRIPRSGIEAKIQFDYFLNILEDTLLRELQQRGENAKRES